MCSPCSSGKSCIVTIDGSRQDILRKRAEAVTNVYECREIVEKLLLTAEQLGVFAGLAAPQVGFSKRVFIFSPNRTKENIEVVINPEIGACLGRGIKRWEACFSVIFGKQYRVAKVTRYESIKVSYLNKKGDRVSKVLDGFAAQVFQHEFDHLEGIVNIEKKDAVVKSFASKEEFDAFMDKVREKDRLRYQAKASL